ncbi:MAG: hypothetical protein A2X22_02850 [Bacteroidetes bacterium GWF2_49_14]|nr:MAG: hypothetical protein A2X22_02850 [Bacteroidetes bacterium GWF2_49_14]HBB93502.1 DUF4386 domain-containing protein [Bacteroidales bacterium]
MKEKVNSLKKTARFAGLLYLIWIITGLYAMFYLPSQTIVPGDAIATANKILANEFIFRTGIINDIISSVIWVVMVLVFYRMFKQVNERQAKLLVAFVIVQIPTVFFIEAFNITSLMIFKGEVLKTFELSQRQDLAMLFLKISDYGVLVLESFWGLWLFPLGILIYRSRFLPRFLGVWLIITGFFYLALCFTSIMMPQYKDMVFNSPLALPVEIGEVAFMLWLLIMGAKNNIPTIEKQ